jgi:ribonucleotide reductase class II
MVFSQSEKRICCSLLMKTHQKFFTVFQRVAMEKSNQILSNLTVYLKYSKYLPALNRRETWEEIVDRNKIMHLKKFPQLTDEIENAYKLVYERKILPSMRSLQFAGKPIELNNCRLYNCSFLPINHPDCFSELMFLLLSGCGVGYSVQNHDIRQLPEIIKPKKTRRYLVGDSIEGWADSVKVLLASYFSGKPLPNFDFRDIRPKGAHLITSGGKAPGAEPLKDCLHNITKIFDRKESGDKLSSLEIHDICCFIADAVLAGGIRRSAMIALFDMDDDDMLTSKFGEWYVSDPQRGRANNTAVIMRHKIEKDVFLELWKKIELSNAGEPGFMFSNDKTMGLNPCVTGDTWIHTSNGPRQVTDLLNAPFIARVNGNDYTSTPFWKTGIKSVYRVITSRGYEVRVTDNHQIKVLTPTGVQWIEAGKLTAGDKIILDNHRGNNWRGTGTFEEGWLVGEIVGDGGHNPDKYRSYCRFWGDSRFDMSDLAVNRTKLVGKTRSDFGNISDSNEKMTVGAVALSTLASHYLEVQSKQFKSSLEQTSSEFHKGFLRGWFDSDGSVQGSHQKGVSVRLTSVDREKLQTAQRMLLRLGIASTIYFRCNERFKSMPNGKGGLAEYPCQSVYELIISRDNLNIFAQEIGFDEPQKSNKLNALLNSYVRPLYKDTFITKFVELIPDGMEMVYDCTVSDVHEFDANGLSVHNCGEVSLRAFQFCNLVTINAANIESQEDLNNRTRAASFIATLQASYTDFHYLREVWRETTEKEALIGVSMTGIAGGKVLSLDLEHAAKIVKEENEKTAKIIGINKAARATVVKPEGTSSLVVGSSSGIHAWHDNYYMRRVRVGKNEAIYNYLSLMHPTLLEDDYFKPKIQAVISIPQKAPTDAITRSESALELLGRVADVWERWIKPGHRKGSNKNNVSTTVSIKKDEWEDVGEWMWNNREKFTALSVLPHDDNEHTYVQAPFESITKKEYELAYKTLEEVDLTHVVEMEDHTNLQEQAACAGNACEIK